MQDHRAAFTIEPDVTGAKSVRIDGFEFKDVLESVSLHFNAGMVPQVFMTFRPGISQEIIKGTGIVIAEASDSDAVANFLSNIDPKALEQEVLNREGWGTSPMETALKVLTQWASGGDRGTTADDSDQGTLRGTTS